MAQFAILRPADYESDALAGDSSAICLCKCCADHCCRSAVCRVFAMVVLSAGGRLLSCRQRAPRPAGRWSGVASLGLLTGGVSGVEMVQAAAGRSILSTCRYGGITHRRGRTGRGGMTGLVVDDTGFELLAGDERVGRRRSLSFPGMKLCCGRSCCVHWCAVWSRLSSGLPARHNRWLLFPGSYEGLDVIGDEGAQGAWRGACDRFDVVG